MKYFASGFIGLCEKGKLKELGNKEDFTEGRDYNSKGLCFSKNFLTSVYWVLLRIKSKLLHCLTCSVTTKFKVVVQSMLN